MEEMYAWMWVVPAVIGIVAVIKVVSLIYQNRNNDSCAAGRNQQIIPVHAGTALRAGATETGPMIYYANDRHGRIDREYRFNYKKVGGSWRAYILRMPSLGNRDASGAVTHRIYDNGRPYVCWDSSVNSLKDMQTISRVWADSIQEYIATGKRFG